MVVRGSRVLACGCNRIGFARLLPNRAFACSVHAEASAILQILKERRQDQLIGATIYVSRIGRGGEPRLAKPCKCCADLIRSVGISRVVYTQTGAGVSEYEV